MVPLLLIVGSVIGMMLPHFQHPAVDISFVAGLNNDISPSGFALVVVADAAECSKIRHHLKNNVMLKLGWFL